MIIPAPDLLKKFRHGDFGAAKAKRSQKRPFQDSRRPKWAIMGDFKGIGPKWSKKGHFWVPSGPISAV